MSEKKVVCWGAGEEATHLVWHHHGLAAKRLLAEDIDCEFCEVGEVRRYSEFDEYRSFDEIPQQILFDAGWWITCEGCFDGMVTESEFKAHGNEVICDDCFKQSTQEGS